ARRLPGEATRAVALSPDGRRALAGGGDYVGAGGGVVGCSLRLWDLRKRAARELAGHQAPVPALALSAPGRPALSGGGGPRWQGGELGPGDCSVRLWDLAAGKEVGRFNGHRAPVLGVAFFPGGKAFASCGADGAVWLWEKGRPEGRRLPGGKAP